MNKLITNIKNIKTNILQNKMIRPKNTRLETLEKNTSDAKIEEMRLEFEIIKNIDLIWLDENVHNNENQKY
jgi:hypothetical protein